MVKAIVFDKDGTLIDFDAFWVSVSVCAINDILKKLDMEDVPVEEMLCSIGVQNGASDADGILCKGTYEQMSEAMNTVLKKYGCDVSEAEMLSLVLDAYNQNAESGEVKATCENIKGVLSALRERNIKLAVVTTDNSEITHKCLQKLEIEQFFCKVYTDDGNLPAKPDPKCLFDFSESEGIEKEKIIMVGDTMTDVRFARNAGVRVVGVGGEKNRRILEKYADAVYPDISYILEFLKGEQ